MIFIVLGTHELPFNRLLKAVDEELKNGSINERVVVQSGHTPYRTERMEFIPFMTYHDMEEFYKESSLIITHGGTGSITMGVKMGKKMIAVPRLCKYGEHNDDHQIEIVRQFSDSGHILKWDDETDLANVLELVHSFEPVPFKSGREQILKLVDQFIELNVN
ncbi:PssE/Cps14G family polysaccharide biosynthesis glycosyltransferase [Falsibacillus pallidus]|uniref:PssE/Cps14G family polysaccharide biosynthesis glycosyltransferase n=1 Tax=Falsibacillus pallidus TaxID=493781 RepID=UPI003D96048E